MKILVTLLFALSSLAFNLHEYSLINSKGKNVEFKSFKGKPVLIVNIATKCGYTPQLDNIEKLYNQYKGKVEVLGVPSNDFGGQTPESDKGVVEFCKRNYGVTFPIMRKTVVKGSDSHPLFKELAKINKEEIKWNFEKFLFDKNGKLVKTFTSAVDPLAKELVDSIKESL